MKNNPPSLRFVANADGAALLDIEHGTVSILNPTGAHLWQALERGETMQSMIRSLTSATGVSPEVVEADVRLFLTALRDAGFIHGWEE